MKLMLKIYLISFNYRCLHNNTFCEHSIPMNNTTAGSPGFIWQRKGYWYLDETIYYHLNTVRKSFGKNNLTLVSKKPKQEQEKVDKIEIQSQGAHYH